jgi:hypothetical protein
MSSSTFILEQLDPNTAQPTPREVTNPAEIAAREEEINERVSEIMENPEFEEVADFDLNSETESVSDSDTALESDREEDEEDEEEQKENCPAFRG